MKNDANRTPLPAPVAGFRWGWLATHVCCWLCIAFVFASLYRWAELKELDHDEYERAHAAWLIHAGKTPYQDFFDHKPPHYWWFVRLYYLAHGVDDGVFLWGRHMTQAAYALSVLFLYLLGRHLYGSATGLAAGVFFACNKLAHYTGTLMRGDALMVMLLTAGIWLFLRAWERKFAVFEALVAGAILGLSVAILPKAVFAVGALGLATAYRCQFVSGWAVLRQRAISLLCFVGAALVPILLPFFLYGWRTYWFFCYVVPLNLEPHFSPYGLFMNIFVRAYGVLPFALFGICIAVAEVRNEHRRSNYAVVLLLLLALNFMQVCSNRLPYIQAFHVFMPFLALAAGRGVGWLGEKVSAGAACAGLALLAVGGLVMNFHPPYWIQPPNLERQCAMVRQLNRFVPVDESCATLMAGGGPVFRMDSTYFPWDFSLKTFQRIEPRFTHDYVREFSETRPFLVQEGMSSRMDHDASQPARFKSWLEQNYDHLTNSEYWVRKPGVSRGRDPTVPENVAALIR